MSEHAVSPPSTGGKKSNLKGSTGYGLEYIFFIVIAVVVIPLLIERCNGEKVPKQIPKIETGAPVTETPGVPPIVVNEKGSYPYTGEGYATHEEPLRVYLDPKMSTVQPSANALYVFENDPDLKYEDRKGIKIQGSYEWDEYPAGMYLIYPLDKNKEKIWVQWWWYGYRKKH